MDLVKQITCSLSEKIQHETYGGAKYTSTDLFESESEQVRADMDFEECEQVWRTLRLRVEARITERKEALIHSLMSKRFKDQPEPVTSVLSHSGASGGVSRLGEGTHKAPFRRFPANSEPAKPREVIPDTPSGEPFPG